MELIRSISGLLKSTVAQRLADSSCVGVTIGNFDGMHLGHRRLFEVLNQEVSLQGSKGVKVLLTFYPHPRIAIARRAERKLNFLEINSFREKYKIAKQFGFDYFLVLPFKRSFAEISPQTFVEKYLSSLIHARVIVVGHDWSFGKEKAGNIKVLNELAREYSMRVVVVDAVESNGLRCGSSIVKELLKEGEIKKASELLARNFLLSGRVIKGEGRGSSLLNIPTANLEITRFCLPKNGVYACYLYFEGRRYPAVTNIGVRPTFHTGRRVVETHLIGVTGIDLYKKRIDLEFIERIRDEKTFSDFKELRVQIVKDIADATLLL